MNYDMNKLISILDKCYYHSFPLKENDFKNIMTAGIKCFDLLDRYSTHYGAWNGRYYISLLKRNSSSLILQMYEQNPLIIINPHIIAFKAKESNSQKLSNTIIPIRYSPYDKEYQAFFHIAPKNFLGISYKMNPDENDYERKLKTLDSIIEWLSDLECELPLINSYNDEPINKDKIKSLLR